ncbi:conserved hypothetical protein [uncultured delta proteobacterium]|uniref:CI repressor n=1 Tax=uncultured delta proteobacterium TaxID=34034 RepID=A0A212K814_9DELT|nr:conserved hypothetical protein [uncultured delta proteobacterium]
MKNFSDMFDIIFEVYRSHARAAGISPSNVSFARFLGHDHDGRVRAWKKGQWPSADDLWQMHQKLGFSLQWLVSGEGGPFETTPSEAPAVQDVSSGSAETKISRIEQLERDIARKSEELEKAGKERDKLMHELLDVQREHMKLLKEQIGKKKGRETDDGLEASLRETPAAYGKKTFHEEKAPYHFRDTPGKE